MSKNKSNQKNQFDQQNEETQEVNQTDLNAVQQDVVEEHDSSDSTPVDLSSSLDEVKTEQKIQTTTPPSEDNKDTPQQHNAAGGDKHNESPLKNSQTYNKVSSDPVNHEDKSLTSVAPEQMAKQQARNAMSIYVSRIKSDGTPGEKMVVETMEAYLSVMSGNRPLDTNTIVREQTRLYTMFKNIGRRTDDFRKAVVVARFFFRENFDGAFHDIRINRGHESLQLSADDRKAFYSYLQLYKIIASVNDLKDIKKSVDVSRSLTNPVIPSEVKERYVSLIN